MATASQIIDRALRLINATDAMQAIESGAEQDARQVLNSIGQRWLASGLIAAWTDATGPQSALSTPASASEALAYQLAIRIAPEYGRPVSEFLAQQAASEVRALWRDRLTAGAAGTAEAIILRALRIITGAGFDNLPDVVSMAGALQTLNALLAEWHEADIGLPDYSFSAIDVDVSTDAADTEALAYQLALRLSGEYGVQLPPQSIAMAGEAMGRLRLRYFQPGTVDYGELPAIGATFNIETGN